jgi:hypothetical protein
LGLQEVDRSILRPARDLSRLRNIRREGAASYGVGAARGLPAQRAMAQFSERLWVVVT